MAKKTKKNKFKNIKLEQNELTPTPIGMFENRRRSSIGTFLILAVFVLAVVFMPQISEFIGNYFNPKPTTPVTPNRPVTPDIPDDDDEPKDNFTTYVDNLSITNKDITVSNVIVDKTNFTISYDVTNNLEQNQNLEELNYYLEIYNSEQTFIERIKLADDFTLINGAFRSYTKVLSSNAASTIGFVGLVKKTTNDYPLVELDTVDGVGSMVCSNSHETITYKFNESALKEVTSEVSYHTTDPNYLTLYQENKLKSNNYNTKIGVVSTMFEYESGYNITTTLNLNEASRMYLFNADSFQLDTDPKVVKFEMEAQGFQCK